MYVNVVDFRDGQMNYGVWFVGYDVLDFIVCIQSGQLLGIDVFFLVGIMFKLLYIDEFFQVELCQVDGGVLCLGVIDYLFILYGGGEFFGEVWGLDYVFSVCQLFFVVFEYWDVVYIDCVVDGQQQQVFGVNVCYFFLLEVFILFYLQYYLNEKGDDVR